MTQKQLNKTCSLTDIHFGCKANSELHNQDCLNYIDWFCDNVRKDPDIDSIVFMGDWFENRSALNVSTLNYSHRGAKKLNDLGLPVFFIIGNHDLYHRHNREVYSTISFGEFDNFTIINEPTYIPHLGAGNLVCPYLFHAEYPQLAEYAHAPVWWGHFEFKGFVITGYNVLMPTGLDASSYEKQKRIFSGHFHKRQVSGNVCYIGNVFPTSFGDANDFERGMAVYTHDTDNLQFLNWVDCPKYIKINMSDIIDDSAVMYQNARVKCMLDIKITYEESAALRISFMEEFNLREFTMDETTDAAEALRDTEIDEDSMDGLNTVDDLVMKMLTDIKTDQIDNNILIDQYKRLTP